MSDKNPPRPEHVPGTAKGEETVLRRGREPGREEPGSHSYRSARDSTSIKPERRRPIDPSSPEIPPA